MSRLEGKVDTGWGFEIIWVTTDKYCGKLLCFNGPGSKTSMHFHKEKEKSWFVNSGQFILRYIDTATAELMQVPLKEGATYNVPPLQPHQLVAMTADAVIFEVSTPDSTTDIYRIGPGDNIKHGTPNE
jgi:mannose-6-phosphate isomerase-like protein (cupin superfamily)